MRIDAYNQINQVYQTSKISKAKAAAAYGNTAVVSDSDQLQISQTGRDYQIAKQAVAGTSDVRADKVAQMKKMVKEGTYHVDPEDFANKLLEKYNAIG